MAPRVLVGMVLLGWSAAVLGAASGRVGESPAVPTPGTPAPAVPPEFQTPRNIGPAGCANAQCHMRELDWANREGDGKRKHLNALNQLDQTAYPQVKNYIAAVGLRDQYAANGLCVKCHGTVVAGNADDGVTCQSCHGPGSLYDQPHRVPGAYAAGAPLPGMRKFLAKPAEWAPVCNDCHVLSGSNADYAKLIAAKHPSGDTFKVSEKYRIVQPHWGDVARKANYAAALRPFDPVPVAPAAPKPAPPPVPPPATPSVPPPLPPTPPPAPPPAARVDCVVSEFSPWAPWTPSGQTTETRSRTRSVLTPPANGGTACPPLVEVQTQARATPSPGAPKAVVDADADGVADLRDKCPATPPGTRVDPAGCPTPITPAPPVDTDRDGVSDDRDACAATPAGSPVDPATGCPPAATDPPPANPSPAAPRGPVAGVADLQGRIVMALEALLRSGARRAITSPAPATTYSGPNADLLRLQQEVINLAIKVLGLPPKPNGGAPGGGG